MDNNFVEENNNVKDELLDNVPTLTPNNAFNIPEDDDVEEFMPDFEEPVEFNEVKRDNFISEIDDEPSFEEQVEAFVEPQAEFAEQPQMDTFNEGNIEQPQVKTETPIESVETPTFEEPNVFPTEAPVENVEPEVPSFEEPTVPNQDIEVGEQINPFQTETPVEATEAPSFEEPNVFPTEAPVENVEPEVPSFEEPTEPNQDIEVGEQINPFQSEVEVQPQVETEVPMEKVSVVEPVENVQAEVPSFEEPQEPVQAVSADTPAPVQNLGKQEEEKEEENIKVDNKDISKSIKDNKSLKFVIIIGILMLIAIFGLPYLNR